MIRLVTVFLKSFVSHSISSPVVGALLDVLFECIDCGQMKKDQIGNCQHNDFYCPNCRCNTVQYTNACNFTVDPRTLEIGHVMLDRSEDNNNYRWVSGDFIFNEDDDHLQIPFRIRMKGLKNRSVVFEQQLFNYNTSGLIVQKQDVITPSSQDSLWEKYTISYHKPNFVINDRGIIVCKTKIRSVNRDILCENTRLFNPFKS